MSDPQRLDYLFGRYYYNQITEEERWELSALVKGLSKEEISGLMKKAWVESSHSETFFRPEVSSGMLSKILNKKTAPVRRMTWVRVAAAAIIIGITVGGYFVLNRQNGVKPVARQETKTDILPGHDGAILTLSDGKKVVLDNAQDGKITDVAIKTGNKLSYVNGASVANVAYNTMSTPKGRQFSLVLSDGTQVWLNAASSITYPTAFVGNERKVSMTGEAYFEVTHNADKPFHVNVNGMDVQVLGTHFNINSYADEGSVKTTLLQGSIKVSLNGKTELVKPGEQTQVVNGTIKVMPEANIDDVMAWKNGFFSFRRTDIKGVMRQIARWYDVDVVYQGTSPDETFTGKIDRNLTLSQMLNGLQATNVHFRIDGKKLIILP